MDSFHAYLKRICPHLSHRQFVEVIMSNEFPRDMAWFNVLYLDELQAGFEEEFWDVVFRKSPASHDRNMRK